MAGRGRPKAALTLSDEEREALLRYVRRGKTAQRLVVRSRIILECAKGLDSTAVAERLGVSNQTVCKWRGRFIADRIDGLLDAPRVGAPRRIGDDKVEEVVTTTLNTMPRGASRWSTRELAKKTGLSHMAIARIWNAFGLKPHRAETFQLSADPQFIEKVRDVVGLYMDPPTNAVVLCVDEKSQIQALNRTQPILPMRPGQLERRTPEYERNGTTSLFAALDVATGGVIGRCFRRHRAKEFVQFLKLIDQSVAPGLEVALDHGQLRHTQGTTCHELVHPTPPLSPPLHSDALIVVESGGELVCDSHQQTDQTRISLQRARARRSDPRVFGGAQCRPETVQVGKSRR